MISRDRNKCSSLQSSISSNRRKISIVNFLIRLLWKNLNVMQKPLSVSRRQSDGAVAFPLLEMDSNVEIRVTKNGTHSSLSRSESFRESKWFSRIMSPSTFDKCCIVLAEVLGTATLMFIGCSSTIHWDGSPVSLMPPLSFGLTVMLIIQIFGHISFAILNPAVAICAVVNNLMSIKVK